MISTKFHTSIRLFDSSYFALLAEKSCSRVYLITPHSLGLLQKKKPFRCLFRGVHFVKGKTEIYINESTNKQLIAVQRNQNIAARIDSGYLLQHPL